MTTQELKNKTRITRAHLYGHYFVSIRYRGKVYGCITTNNLAWDRIVDSCLPNCANVGGYTLRGALMAIYRECKRKNNL